MEDKVKSLDKFISEDCGGDLEKARNLFKSVVQDILSSSEFRIENTVRNSAFTRITGLGKTKQGFDDYATQIPEKKFQIVESSKLFINDLPKEQKPVNKSDEKYKNFIKQLVSVENYFDKSEDKGRKIEEVYNKITSSLKPKNENDVFVSAASLNYIGTLNNNSEDIALDLQSEAINGVNNLTEEQKEWNNIFVKLSELKVWNPSLEELRNIFSLLKSGSGFHIKVNWRDKSICSELNDQQKKLLEKMEKENADRVLKAEYQEYIKSKIYGHKDDLFSILDAIAAVDLELCMRELDELTKSVEKPENAKEDEKKDNENKIIINKEPNPTKEKEEKEPNPTKEKEEKVKNIKEQLKHRARLLGFNSSNAFCDVIDKISAEPIDEFKSFVKNCQNKFDKYQKDCGSISEISEISTNTEEKKIVTFNGMKDTNTEYSKSNTKKLELDIVKDFYTEAKKQAKEILKQKKKDEENNDNPKILAVEFVLDLMDNMDNKNLNTEISEELRFLVNGTKQLDKGDDFGFENLQSIVKSVASTRDLSEKLFDSNLAKRFYNMLGKINNDYSKSILKAIDSLKKVNQTHEDFLTDILNQKNNTFVSEFFEFAFNDKQEDKKNLEYAKKFYLGMLSQFFIQFEGDGKGYEFLSLVFKQYFIDKIESTKDVKSLEPIIDSINNFEDNFCLFEDPETSLSLLMDNTENITNKDHLDVFCDAYSECLKYIKGKIVDNRKLLVDLKKIFLDENLDSKVAFDNISPVVNLLTKLDENPTNVQEKDFEGLSNVLLAYAEQLIKNTITDWPLLSETLKFQLQIQNLKEFDINAKRELFTRLLAIKENGLQDQDKPDLRNYFWLHVTEIFKQKKEFTEAEAMEFYGFIQDEAKGDNQYFKLLNSAIDTLGLSTQKYLVEILNQDDNFKNIITLKNGKENGKEEEKEKAYKSILQSLVKQKLKAYETEKPQNKFLSSAFEKYFVNSINEAQGIDDLNRTVELVKNFIENNYLPNDPKTLLDVLIENAVNVKDYGDLVAFFTSVADSVGKMNNVKGYENRKLLVDLKDIFLDDVMHRFKNEDPITHIESVAKLLTKLDDGKEILKNDFWRLGEILYTYEQRSIRDNIKEKFPLLEATLAFQAHYGFAELNINEKKNLFKRLLNIKDNGLQDQDKKDLKDYFWSHATEIKSEKKFTETEAMEFYGFIQDEEKGDNQYFKLLNSAIGTLGLSTQEYLVEMLNQNDNFNNIIALKNGEKEKKEKAYKSILKSLVKQRLNQKGGFVSSAYIKRYQLVIDNANAIADEQSKIVSGVQNVLKDDFQPDTQILIAALGELEDKDNKNKALSDFWESCCKSEKDERQEQKKEEKKSTEPVNNQSMNDKAGNNGEENEIIIDTSDNKNEKKDISNNDKILDALSYIFIDLLKHDVSKANNENKINNSNNIINEEAGLDLVEITKKFVLSLYKANEDDKKEENINTNSKEGQEINEQPKKDNTGITGVLNKYYDTIDKARLSEDSLGMHGDLVLKNQINNFHNLDDDSKIKLLQCMKNIKDNSPTNDDLVYINLCAYEIKKEQLDNPFNNPYNNPYDSPFKELQLITGSNDNSSKTLAQFFQSCGGGYLKKVDPHSFALTKMEEDQIKSVIKNIGKKEKITDPKEQKNFAGAVVFVLEKQIQGLKSYYENDNYEEIDKYKTYWKNLIGALEEKGLVSHGQKEDFGRQIDNACDLNAVVGVLEWILSALAAIFVISLASKTIRKTLHSPLKSRKARHLIKSADANNGIFSRLRELANDSMPAQGKDIKDHEI